MYCQKTIKKYYTANLIFSENILIGHVITGSENALDGFLIHPALLEYLWALLPNCQLIDTQKMVFRNENHPYFLEALNIYQPLSKEFFFKLQLQKDGFAIKLYDTQGRAILTFENFKGLKRSQFKQVNIKRA